MSGLKYIHSKPFEKFCVPSDTDLLGAAACLLSFVAYPQYSQIKQRQQSTDALLAWIFRDAINHGKIRSSPFRLNRDNLPTAQMRRRVLKTCRLFQEQSLQTAWIGMQLSFRRGRGIGIMAKMFAAHFDAHSFSVAVPANFKTEAAPIRQLLQEQKSPNALWDETSAIKDYRRRVWHRWLPSVPLSIAIHYDHLKYDPLKEDYAKEYPGHGVRFPALSLLYNPDRWVSEVIDKAQIRRALMLPHFETNAFAEILPEGTPSDRPSAS